MAEIPELLEEADVALEENAENLSATMNVDLSVGSDIVETNWIGNTMEMDMAETTAMTKDVTSSLMSDALSDESLLGSTSKLSNEVETLLGYPYGEVGDAVTTETAKASGDISKLETETEASEMSKSSKWSKTKLVGKIFMYGTGILLGLDWVAGKLAGIITTMMDADNAPSWTKDLTDAEKEELKDVTAALPKLSIILQSWVSQWKTYKDKNVDLGTLRVTISSTPHDVPVMLMLFYAFKDMDGMITNTKSIFSGGADSLSAADVIVAMNNIFVVLADALSVYSMKKQSANLKAYKFPPAEDEETMNKIIMSFKDGQAKVKAVGVKYLRFAATNAVTAYLQVKITRDIYHSLQNIVLPQMRAAAKAAFKKAAQHHMDSEKSAIQALAWVPGAGISMARDKIAKEQKVAAEEGTAAAKRAAEQKLAELRPQVIANAKLAAKKHTDVDQRQLKIIADLAIDSALGQVKSAVKK